VRALALLALAGAACGTAGGSATHTPEQPEFDSRAVTRCEHGRDDGQTGYGMQVWLACFRAARFFGGEQPIPALRYSRRSCDLGYAEGCIQYLDFVRALAPRLGPDAREHVEHAREIGIKFCKEGLFTFELREYESGEA
jgi:hypothetical protein